jgi:hypothetical protein
MNFFFILGFLQVDSAETNNFQKYDDPGTCICDLTKDSCDEFCCCDSDCNNGITWDECAAERYSTYGEKYCTDSRQVFKVNKRRGLEEVSGGSEKCVKVDNSAKIDGFHSIVGSVSSDKVNTRLEDSSTYDDLFMEKVEVKSKDYQLGDGVFQLNASFPDPSGRCVLGKVAFFLDYNGTCVWTGNLSEICTSVLAVDSDYDSKTFTKRNYLTGVEETADSSPKTSYTSNKCLNAVVETRFIVQVGSGLKSVDATKLKVHYILTDITSSSLVSVPQATHVKFVTSTSFKSLSGNPGYLKDKPLLVKTGSKEGYLHMTGKDSTGECSSSPVMDDESVKFGNDLVWTCSKTLTYNELKSFCETSVKDLLIFKPVLDLDKIGKWGSSETTDDWISITSPSSKSGSFSGSTCSLSSSLVLNIYYTNIGSFSNPQLKVVYATRSFKQHDWRFTSSDPSKSQIFLFSSFINFIPYNSKSDPYHSSPRLDTIMPQNVLDPVRTSSFSVFFVVPFLLFN